MTEGILFSIGFIVFIATTTATLLFGYLQFNRVYREDRVADGRGFSVDRVEDGYEVMTSGSDTAPLAAAPPPRS